MNRKKRRSRNYQEFFIPGWDGWTQPAFFLDYLGHAPKGVQMDALKLTMGLDTHSYHLPEGWKIMAAKKEAHHG